MSNKDKKPGAQAPKTSEPVVDQTSQVSEEQGQENTAPPVVTVPAFVEAKHFNEWERGISLPAFPTVTLGTWTISEVTVTRIFRAGIERLVSAATAPVKGSKDAAIRELMDLLAAGYLTASEKEKAGKVVPEKSGGKVVYFSRPEILDALRELGYGPSADYITTLSATQFEVAYRSAILNPGSKILAAHTHLIAEAARKAEEAQKAALSGLDASLL